MLPYSPSTPQYLVGAAGVSDCDSLAESPVPPGQDGDGDGMCLRILRSERILWQFPRNGFIYFFFFSWATLPRLVNLLGGMESRRIPLPHHVTWSPHKSPPDSAFYLFITLQRNNKQTSSVSLYAREERTMGGGTVS